MNKTIRDLWIENGQKPFWCRVDNDQDNQFHVFVMAVEPDEVLKERHDKDLLAPMECWSWCFMAHYGKVAPMGIKMIRADKPGYRMSMSPVIDILGAGGIWNPYPKEVNHER
jgi:hypothetical protein